MSQESILPGIKTTHEFKKQVEQACNAVNLAYPADSDFVESAHEAFRSEKIQQTLKKLGEKYDPHRTYPNAVKVL